MKVCHVSDTHGYPIPLSHDGEAVLHTGDLLPNKTRGIDIIEVSYQQMWVEQHMRKFKNWIGDRPFLFVPGNHDYYDPIPAMVAAGIDARDMRGHSTFAGLSFYGYDQVPYFTGEWNREASESMIERSFCPERADVIMAHSPIYGVLDRNAEGIRCGSWAIRGALQSEHAYAPKWYLHGHIHEAAGLQGWSRGTMVSNAATTTRLIEL